VIVDSTAAASSAVPAASTVTAGGQSIPSQPVDANHAAIEPSEAKDELVEEEVALMDSSKEAHAIASSLARTRMHDAKWPQLEYINISDNPVDELLVDNTIQSLQFLIANNCNFTTSSLRSLATLPSLETLSLQENNIDEFAEEVKIILKSFKRLNKVALGSNNGNATSSAGVGAKSD
jgi:Leucine-rich repeat (LRR) protein